MARKQVAFELPIGTLPIGEVRISGIAYFYNDDPDGNFIDYDLNEITWNGMNVLRLCNWLGGGAKEIDKLHYPIYEYLKWLKRQPIQRFASYEDYADTVLTHASK